MSMSKHRLATSVWVLLAICQTGFADDNYIEFNDDFIFSNAGKKSAIDVSQYARGNPVKPGIYTVSVWINGEQQQTAKIQFIDNHTPNASPCLTREVLDEANVDVSKLPTADADEGESQCYILADYYPSSSVSYDPNSQILTLTIPQLFLVSHPAGYVNPARWDAGIPAAILNWSFSGYHSENDGSASDSGYLGLGYGLNLGAWRLRSSGALNWTKDDSATWGNYDLYLARDLPPMRAQMELGQVTSRSEVLDSIGIKGIHLYNDKRMDPHDGRYVPVINGVANSNAKITVRQQSRIIYETTVPPGPFALKDYYVAINGADLDVTVEEADGSKRLFTVPYASVAQLMTKGEVDWDFAVGTLDNNDNSDSPWVLTTNGNYGLSDIFTLYGGIQSMEEDYLAGMLGLAMNTRLGAIAVDVIHSRASLEDIGALQGQSYRVSYSNVLDATQTNFSFSAYRYSTKDYLSLNDVISLQNSIDSYSDDHDTNRNDAYRNSYSHSKNELQANVNQPINLNGEDYGSFYLSGTWTSYWGSSDKTSQYSLGYSNTFRTISWNISLQRSYNEWGDEDDSLYVGLSIPFGSNAQNDQPAFSSLNLSANSDFSGNNGFTSTASGNSSNNKWNYSLSTTANQASQGEDTYSVSRYSTYNGAHGATSVSATVDKNHNQQYSLNNNGGVLLHSGGLTLLPGNVNAQSAIALIEAQGADGATTTNGYGEIDSAGYAVATSLSPYAENTVGLDLSTIKADVEVKNTSAAVVPRDGAVVKVTFATQQGQSVFVTLRRSDNSFIPLGANILNEQGESVGAMGQAGRAFLRGIEQRGSLKVIWGSDAASYCDVSYQIPDAPAMIGKSIRLETLICQMPGAGK
ncbi:outer membrane usher protein [Citrobacter freundii]|uniref:outer membrane usher protein n=1 Tax=Citrobacter freundii TaxID=546 RepID=UPI003989C0E2